MWAGGYTVPRPRPDRRDYLSRRNTRPLSKSLTGDRENVEVSVLRPPFQLSVLEYSEATVSEQPFLPCFLLNRLHERSLYHVMDYLKGSDHWELRLLPKG